MALLGLPLLGANLGHGEKCNCKTEEKRRTRKMDVNITVRIEQIDGLIAALDKLAGKGNPTQGGTQPALQASASPVPVQAPQQTLAYSAQIAQNTQLPVQAMTGKQAAPTQQQPAQTVPTTARTYTLDELASAAMPLIDKGMQQQLQELLAGYGVEALPMLPQEQYGNFATALRGMGAQI